MLTTLAVENYRSLRRGGVAPPRPDVVTGANGAGKASPFPALPLLADASRNGAVAALAREGGLQSTLWAGPEHVRKDRPVQGTVRTGPVALRMGFASEDYGYAVDFGLPVPTNGVRNEPSAFNLDPEIKHESLWAGPFLRPAALLMERGGAGARIRDNDVTWQDAGHHLPPFASMLSEFADPQRAPELLALRERMRTWRFSDHLPTASEAPARQAQIGPRTPILDPEGASLAA